MVTAERSEPLATASRRHPTRRPGLLAVTTTLLLVAGALAEAGCLPASPRRTAPRGGNRVPPPAGSPAATTGRAGGAAPVNEPPLDALNRLDPHLRRAGYVPDGPAQRNTGVPPGGVVAYQLQARPGQCYAVIAFSEPGTDVDLLLLSPAGQTIAHDVRPDHYPHAAFCPTQPGPHVARVQMAQGSSEVIYAVYRGPAGSDPNLAGYFGEAQSAGPQQARLDAVTQQRLTGLDRQLVQEGFVRAGEPQGLVLQAGQERLFPVELEPGRCYAFASLGGPGAEDTDIFLVDGNGREVLSDTTTNLDGVIRYCPTQPVSYQLKVKMYTGAGPLFSAAWRQAPGSTTPTPGGPPPGETPSVIGGTSVAGAGIEENFRLLDADMRARGYEPLGDPGRGQLGEGGERLVTLELEGGKCYALLAVGDNGIRDIDLEILDPTGRPIDRDIEEDARPVVRVCPRTSGAHQMKVKLYRGAGSYVYATYRWPRGVRGPFGLEGLIYVRLAEVTSLLDVEGYQPDIDADPGRGELAREGASARHRLQLAPGQCYAILVVGGDGVYDLGLSLTQAGRVIGSDDDRTAFPSVRVCADAAGPYELQVTAVQGRGSYFYQVFKRG